jgi:hypothetical protein
MLEAELIVRKLVVITYITTFNFLCIALLAPRYAGAVMQRYDAQMSKARNMASLLCNINAIVTFAYFIRQLSEKIPLPLSRGRFDATRVKERRGSVLHAFSMFLFFDKYVREFAIELGLT